jgi:hypothetical protein
VREPSDGTVREATDTPITDRASANETVREDTGTPNTDGPTETTSERATTTQRPTDSPGNPPATTGPTATTSSASGPGMTLLVAVLAVFIAVALLLGRCSS